MKKVHIKNKTLTQMMNFAQEHPHNEVLGIFFGKTNENGDIEINIANNFRVGTHTNVEFIDDDYVKAVPLIKENAKNGLDWIGWFHSHPFQKGDHIYMSRTDIIHHYHAQLQNPSWTAIILNPYQIQDSTTLNGARAFQLKYNKSGKKLLKKSIPLQFAISLPI